jgi:N-acetylglutamate synthase-like GNAT family acetyltransferase
MMPMKIRKGTYHDAPFIKLLMEGLGYKTSNSLLITQLTDLFSSSHHEVLVCEEREEVTGFAVVHVLPQLAFDGGLLIISYLSIDERVKDQGVARALESHIVELARKRKCERIQVHCAGWRAQAHHFFLGQGYADYPQYFTKRIIYGE